MKYDGEVYVLNLVLYSCLNIQPRKRTAERAMFHSLENTGQIGCTIPRCCFVPIHIKQLLHNPKKFNLFLFHVIKGKENRNKLKEPLTCNFWYWNLNTNSICIYFWKLPINSPYLSIPIQVRLLLNFYFAPQCSLDLHRFDKLDKQLLPTTMNWYSEHENCVGN